MAMGSVQSMMIPLILRRSDRKAIKTVLVSVMPCLIRMRDVTILPVTGVATAYGMTDHNCTLFASVVMFKLAMMVGSFARRSILVV